VNAVAALRAGSAVILPTDTVYGLCATAETPEATARMYALKGRDAVQPSALLAAGIEQLLAAVPELDTDILRALLPGPFTLVLPNPERRYPWLTGAAPGAIGVRVPDLPDAARRVVLEAGCIVATSANLPGGPDPRRIEDVPEELRLRVEAVVDAGELPGTPSTVLDFTGDAPRVIREGAASSADALERVAALLR
jgi:L-threonylcarbamoyladenylate synthase